MTTTQYVMDWESYERVPVQVEALILYSDYNGQSIKLYSPNGGFEGDDAEYAGIGLVYMQGGSVAVPLEVKVVADPKEVVLQTDGGIAI